MRTVLTVIVVICCAGAALGQQPSQPPKPGPEHQKLGIWVGDWQYEGEAKDSSFGPGGRFSGQATARWVLNGFVLEVRAQEKTPLGDMDTIEFDWYDPAARTYPSQAYTNLGIISSGTGTVSGNVWKGSGRTTFNGVDYQFRGETIFAADGMSYTGKSEISTDGKTWAPFSEGKGIRVARPTAGAEQPLTNVSTGDKTTKAASASAQAEQELIKLENGWNEANVKGDVTFLDQILAEEITDTDSEGAVWTKAREIADLKSGDIKFTSLVADGMRVRVYGDMAIVTGRNTVNGYYRGRDISGQRRWTDTWIRREGRWQCVATHASKIAEKKSVD